MNSACHMSHMSHATHVTHMSHTCHTCHTCHTHVTHVTHVTHMHHTNNTVSYNKQQTTHAQHAYSATQHTLSLHTSWQSKFRSVAMQCNATNNSMYPVAMQCNKQQNIQCNAMQYSLTTALREPYQHTLCCNAVQYQLPESCNRSTSDLIFYMMRCDGNLVRMNHTYLSFTLQAIWEQMVLLRKPGQGGK